MLMIWFYSVALSVLGVDGFELFSNEIFKVNFFVLKILCGKNLAACWLLDKN